MHVVKFEERERGWGGEVWFRSFDSEIEATREVEDVMSKLPDTYVPDYYIQAWYIGDLPVLPEGYKL